MGFFKKPGRHQNVSGRVDEGGLGKRGGKESFLEVWKSRGEQKKSMRAADMNGPDRWIYPFTMKYRGRGTITPVVHF